MQKDIEEIIYSIKSGRFANEASVSLGVVQRILNLLGWPIYDTDIVSPEYSIEGKRVDYALCHPARKPLVFIEVKQVGKSDGADKQLFEYSFHLGVPMAILTDGPEWHFFLPGEQGDYGERRVYKLDLLERSIEESVYRLNRYLNYKDICSGDAINAARKDYRDVTRKRDIENSLPEAWNKLVNEGDEILIELLSDQVENICGYKPDPDTVTNFLSKKIKLVSQEIKQITPAIPEKKIRDELPIAEIKYTGRFGFSLSGSSYNAKNSKDVLIKVLKKFDEIDDSFLDRFASLPKHGRTRRFLARSKEELYPNRPDLARDYSFELRSGWWLGTNVGNHQITRIIEMACDVMGLKLNKDLFIYLG